MREERETVAAIATALGEGGIGIIRISGDKALEIADAVLDRPISGAPGYSMHYRHVRDKGEVLDEVLASVFRAPHSFTGEDSVEINCHGGLFSLTAGVGRGDACRRSSGGAGRILKAGFLNGRIDLAQAEAVMDLIGAKNEYALQAAMNQLDGRLSDKMQELRSDILDEIAWIEAALDDPENYDLEGYPALLSGRIETMLASLEELLRSADNGRLCREGIPTVILGLPNAGKSSLMNLLTQNDAAIVTDIAGTTRDILTEQVRLGELLLTLSDTAGIRESEDQIERIGVERARKAAEAAELLLLVLDGSKPLSEEEKELLSYAGKRRSILLLNKADLGLRMDETELLSTYGPGKILRFSTKTAEGLSALEETVTELFFEGVFDNRSELLSVNARHKEAIREAIESLRNVQASVSAGMPEDFFSIDLSAAYRALGTITGDSVEDDVINRIFEKVLHRKVSV